MHDFRCKNPDDMHYKELAEKTRYLKEEQGGEKAMGDVIQKLMDEFRDEFRAEARAEVRAEVKAEVKAEVRAEEQAKAAAKVTKAEAKAAKAEAKAAKAEAKAAKAERKSLAKKMLANNESIEKVALYSSLSLREVRALAKKLSA